MPEAFDLPFAQRALWVLLLLAVAGGVLGTWIVLRGLAFYSHAVGTAAFPGLVLADGLAFAAPLGAVGAAGALALGVWIVTRGSRTSTDNATAIVLVGCLALGVLLASDVFESGANIETLLFGSLLVIGEADIRLAAAAALLAIVLTVTLGQRWLARGFDQETARSLGTGGRALDAALLGAVGFAAIAALSIVGALLATALLVVPAATTRIWFRRLVPWQIATVALTAVLGVGGVWLAVETNAPPGATIAALAGGAFLVSALVRLAVDRGTRLPATAAAALLALLAAGCGSDSTAADGRLPVVATTTHAADFTRAVGGDRVAVTQLLQPNTDPHDYEPRPGDVRATAAAKLVVVSGLGIDHWMADEIVPRSGGEPAVVDLGERVPVKRPGDGDEGHDAHWWHDPRNVEAAVARIRDELAKADPAGAADYRANADVYLRKVAALDAGIARCMGTVPRGERKLVTDHDAFGYFTDRYGITVVGAVIPSKTTQAQPSAGEIAELARTIEREGVRAIFPEESLNPRLADALAKQTGATSEYTLYGDTLGPKGSPGATYLGMAEANANSMVRGFSGGEQACRIEGLR